jgi:hypothetical protein
LAIYHSKLFVSKWESDDHNYNLLSTNYNLDKVWEGIVAAVGDVEVEQGNTLDEQIAVDEQREKILRQIASLERQMRATKQPRRQRELYTEIKKLKESL